ncbi:MAG: HNH endonuclease [Dehalococcoidales bacterium]|nr:HNH endonuclease [Dehalococcoidales bacterium]
MAFTESVVKQAWERAGGQCECRRRTHSHFYIPCGKQLRWEVRGKASQGGWESHQTRVGGGDTLENCEILCWQCHDTIY